MSVREKIVALREKAVVAVEVAAANIKSTKYDRLIVDLWDTTGDHKNNDTDLGSDDSHPAGDVLINERIVAHGYAEPWTG